MSRWKYKPARKCRADHCSVGCARLGLYDTACAWRRSFRKARCEGRSGWHARRRISPPIRATTQRRFPSAAISTAGRRARRHTRRSQFPHARLSPSLRHHRRREPDDPLEEFRQGIGVTGWRIPAIPGRGPPWRRRVSVSRMRSWYAGRLTGAHPIVDRLGGLRRPGRIEAVPGERPMMDLLESGELDAVFTPFMPDGFFGPSSNFRHLLPDYRAEELAYFRRGRLRPGDPYPRHQGGLCGRASLAATGAERPPRRIPSGLAEEAPQICRHDTMDHRRTRSVARDLPQSWNASGLEANAG